MGFIRFATLVSALALTLVACGDIEVTGGQCLVGSTVECVCGTLAGKQTCEPPGQLGPCVCETDASSGDADATPDAPTDTVTRPDVGPDAVPDARVDAVTDATTEVSAPDAVADADAEVTIDIAPELPPPCDPPGQLTCGEVCATCPTGAGVVTTGCEGTECVATECGPGYYPCSGDCCEWNITVPDQSSPLGERMKLALTPDDKLVFAYHFAFVSPPSDGVRVLTQSGISWSTSDVTNGGLHYLGLDVGADGTIAVTTDKGTNFGVNVFRSSGDGTWTERGWPDATVNPITIVAAHPAVTSGGQPHVIIRDEGVGTGWFKHAFLTQADAWDTTTLAGNVSTAVLDNNESIALDSANQPHVAYYDGVLGQLEHQFNAGSGWETRTVAVGETASPSIAVTTNDLPRVAYSHVGDDTIRFAIFDGTWSSEDVFPAASTQVALALGPNNGPYIAYLNNDEGGRLELARKRPEGWVISVVDTDTEIGAVDIVVRSNGDVAIGYEDTANKRIKLATP